MLQERKQAFDTISRVLAITKLDIEHHQVVNDLSLNIHGEDYFKDLFNFIYKRNFINANFGEFNAPFIDLIDHDAKEIVQITTTRTKEKILHTLNALSVKKYSGYKISIYYLLDKAMPITDTVKEVESKFNVKLKEILKDSRDLISAIVELETNSLIELCDLYFRGHEQKYTDKIVLDLVYKKLLKEKSVTPHSSYDDDLGSLETDKKLIINKINPLISCDINRSLDYTTIVGGIDEGSLSEELKNFVINDLYKNILIYQLKSKVSKSDLVPLDVSAIHIIALEYQLDFNKVINALHQKLESLMVISDFNSMAVSWILVAYFFEICDVGVRVDDFTH
jgi:23S rRNA U2552 (ribose-2'-O)-methylase RlmE/FtsJ